MRSLVLSFVVFFAICTSGVHAKFLTLNEIGEASCRVRVSSAAGSGTSIAEDDDSIYVLTNAHVVGSNKSATCEFFRYGRKTTRIPGSVVWKSHNERTVNDFAIIKLQKSAFGDYPPRIAPFAPVDHQIKQNDYIASAGCPQARWLQLWEGHALSDAGRDRVLFTPPPLGGQSGSGVYTVIDGDTYLCGVLTWSIQGKGGAIHIGNFLRAYKGETSDDYFNEKVPRTWEYISTTIEVTAVTRKAYYALGDNGLYYMQNFNSEGWKEEVTLPVGHEYIKIKKWNVILEVQCPGGRCPPIINPNRPPSPGPSPGPAPDNGGGGGGKNPYGTLPPNLGPDFGGNDEGGKGQIDDYKKKIETLEQQIRQLTTERNTLNQSITDLNSSLSEQTSTLERLKKDLERLKSAKDIDNDQIDSLNNRIMRLNGSVLQQISNMVDLEEDLKRKDEALGSLNGEYEILQGQTQQVKTQRNILGWLFGGTTTGVTVWGLLSFYWKWRGKRKVKNIIEDRFDPEEITDVIGGKIDDIEERRTGDLRGLADYLQDKLESTIENQLDTLQDKLYQRIDRIEEVATKERDINIYNTVDDRDTVKVMPTHSVDDTKRPIETPQAEKQTDDCDQTVLDDIRQSTFPPASDRIKEFIDLKKSDGERIEELAFYAHLYKEAVDLLKRNKLIVTKGAAPYKVSSQVKAGEAVEQYVHDQFLKRVSSATISRHILYHEAMIGFLYRQAVGKLKKGEFNVLGYREVAGTVEKWVKVEFLKRMGFDF